MKHQQTAQLKNNTLAPPDLWVFQGGVLVHRSLILIFHRLVNGYQGITWRLAYGVDNPNEPEGMSFFYWSIYRY